MKKMLYFQPLAEFLDLEIEENVLQTASPDYIPGGGGSYGDDDTNNNGDF